MRDRSANLISATPRWCGDVLCRRVAERSTLVNLYSTAPLKLIGTSPVGQAAHVVLSSFGGGMVSGDVVPLRFRIDSGACCVVTTQSSSKVYKSTGETCIQSLDAGLKDRAFLLWLPDPLVCYAGSRYEQFQRFNLNPTSDLVLLDWLTSGRWNRNERWAFESVLTRTELYLDGKLFLRESFRLDELDNLEMRFGHLNCYATFIAVGPRLKALVQQIQNLWKDQSVQPEAKVLLNLCPLEHGVMIRMMGSNVQSVQSMIRPLIGSLSDVIGGNPWSRKW